LNLEENKLISLPANFGKLTHLQELDLSDNELESLPESLTALENLRILDLRNNNLKQLPKGFDALSNNLQELYLTGNPLEDSEKERILKLFKFVDL
jgi:Leucine-rich repeat (LRR) protein